MSTQSFLLASCLMLQACAAALIPAAIGGLAARHRMNAHAAAKPERPLVASDTRPRALPAALEPGISDLEAAPTDPAALKAGTLYRGAAPEPTMVAIPPRPNTRFTRTEAASPPSSARSLSDWNDLSRHVAGHLSVSPRNSVLLLRGATLAAPRWAPCNAKPLAVLTDLDAVVSGSGKVSKKVAAVLGAVETLQVTVIYTTQRTGKSLDSAVTALTMADLRAPVTGSTLFPVAAGQGADVRAAVGARYCVIAIAGDRAEDFPNNATPDSAGILWNAGWFFVPRIGRGTG